MGILDDVKERQRRQEEEKATNAANADIVAKFKQKAADEAMRNVYTAGQNDERTRLHASVQQRMAQKRAEARLLDLQDIAASGGFSPEWVAMANSLTNKPDSYPLTVDDLGLLAPHRSQEALASEAASLRGKSGGNLSLDDLAFLSRQVSDDAYAEPNIEDRRIDITPGPRGLAETYRGQ